MPPSSSISLTGHFTAQVWVRHGVPCAERFDTVEGRLIYRLLGPVFSAAARIGYPTPPQFLIQRHRIMDALVARLQPPQLVELAAGLSPRCLAWAQQGGGLVVDTDLDPVVQLKARMLGPEVPHGYHLAPLDVVASRDYAATLGALVTQRSPTVVITEGILPYLPLSLVRHLFARVAALIGACGGGAYITDVHHHQELDRLGAPGAIFWRALQLVTRTSGHRMIENRAQGTQLLGAAGFREVIVHDPSEWRDLLGFEAGVRDAGMVVYEARI